MIVGNHCNLNNKNLKQNKIYQLRQKNCNLPRKTNANISGSEGRMNRSIRFRCSFRKRHYLFTKTPKKEEERKKKNGLANKEEASAYYYYI